MKTTKRYKKRGWFGESHRHYLAAKGISTTYDHKYLSKIADDLAPTVDKFRRTDLVEGVKSEPHHSITIQKNAENIYQQKGFKNRGEYLDNLAADHGVDPDVVHAVAQMLGENEDFDGLVVSIEDAAREGYGDSEYFFKKLNRSTPKLYRVVEKDGKLTEFAFLQDAIKHAENEKQHIIMPDGSVKWVGDSVLGEGFTSRPMYTHKFADQPAELEDKRPERTQLKFGAHKFEDDGRYSVIAQKDMKTHWKYDLLDGMTGEVHAKTLEKPTRSVEMNPARLVHDILENNTERVKQPRERPTTKRVHSFGDAYEKPLYYVEDMIK